MNALLRLFTVTGDAAEAALILQLGRLTPQIGRLEDAPAEITALLAKWPPQSVLPKAA